MVNKLAISRQALAQWYEVIQGMLEEVLIWLGKKNKHWASGYPLATSLLCICVQQRDFPVPRFDGFVEKLHKLLRDKLFSDAVRSFLDLLECCVFWRFWVKTFFRTSRMLCRHIDLWASAV